jgi:predicted alternative tryptophan synthase beta-subunit
MTASVKYLLDEWDIPRCWYNINADLPEPLLPVLHPGTTKPITADDLGIIFPRAVIEQEMSLEREIEVYMVKVSFRQKPYRRAFMESFGATCIASPSDTTNAGRAILAEHSGSTGSLGIAISETVDMQAYTDYLGGKLKDLVCDEGEVAMALAGLPSVA